MEIGNIFNATPDMTQILIRKTENGYLLRVVYSSDMLDKTTALDAMLPFLTKMAKKQDMSNEDPAEVIQSLTEGMNKLKEFQKEKPLRKMCEEFVFSNCGQLISFIKEIFSEHN